MIHYSKFLLWVLLFTFTATTSWAGKVVGRLMVVKGKVSVLKKNGKKSKARVGMKIRAQETVVTKKDSRAKIVMLDKNIIHVSPSSKISLDKYVLTKKEKKGDVLLNVIYGKVRSKVNQKYDDQAHRFQVKTKAAVAGVRGTDFLSQYNPSTGKAQFVTFEGLVEVGKPGVGQKILNSVMVPPGKFTTSLQNSVPSLPIEMPKEQFVNIQKDSQIPSAPLSPGEGRIPANDPTLPKDKKDHFDNPTDDPAGHQPDQHDDKQGQRPPRVSPDMPAEMSPGEMLTPDDLGPDIPNGPGDFDGRNPAHVGGQLPNGDFIPPPIFDHDLPTQFDPHLCPSCLDIIQNGKTRLLIEIK